MKPIFYWISRAILFSLTGFTTYAQTAQINNPTGATIPFNSNASYSYGIMPTNLPTTGTYTKSQDAANAYTTWVTDYVVNCGGTPTQYRVLFDDGSSTVSEGIGYGMLIAAYAADKTMFDGFYAYYKANADANGLMNWKMSGCTGTSGTNAASDADEDAAMALTVAACQWPSATSPYTYKTEATNIITAINKCEVDTKTSPANQMSNGDGWIVCNTSGNTCRNPSYQAPAYYKYFATYVSSLSTQWTNTMNAGYTLVNANRNATTGLVTDWCDQNGVTNSCNGSSAGTYGYDACRNPWRMAADMAWNNDANASSICNKIATYVNGIGAAAIAGPVAQTGGTGATHNASFVSTFAAGIVGATPASTYQTIMNSMYTQTVSTTDALPAYFGNTLRVLSLFLQTGNFWKPCSASLPVSLLNFDATKQESVVLLNWSTASEQNSSYFSVQRSTDGINFSNIGTVNGAGNSSTLKNYQYTDSSVSDGINYYRIMQVNFNGQSQTSYIISLTVNHGLISVFPNPFSNEIIISSTSDSEDMFVKITDLTGRCIFETSNYISGQNIILSDSILPGLYLLSVIKDDIIYTSKIIKK